MVKLCAEAFSMHRIGRILFISIKSRFEDTQQMSKTWLISVQQCSDVQKGTCWLALLEFVFSTCLCTPLNLGGWCILIRKNLTKVYFNPLTISFCPITIMFSTLAYDMLRC